MQDRMHMGDGFGMVLDCAHEYSGGAMICLRCGQPYEQIMEIKANDNLEYADGCDAVVID